MGLKESPAKLGFKGENHWIYSAYDHDRAFQKQSAAPDKAIDYCYMSFASLKDTTQTAHTAQILLFVDYEFFSKWQEQNWRHREEEYYRLKEAIAQNILNFVESRYPGFKDLVEYYELSTPLTFAYFDASDRGAIYGIPCVPERVGKKWLSAKTPIENLYHNGNGCSTFGNHGRNDRRHHNSRSDRRYIWLLQNSCLPFSKTLPPIMTI
ncbi:MAG: hypothetical protein HC784_06245 [Hydrococcus sp. CSU_1_8]|nr:hypothetical protein [Hydrococcus sp. CSU_1_8]